MVGAAKDRRSFSAVPPTPLSRAAAPQIGFLFFVIRSSHSELASINLSPRGGSTFQPLNAAWEINVLPIYPTGRPYRTLGESR